jgi:hypothetical protein
MTRNGPDTLAEEKSNPRSKNDMRTTTLQEGKRKTADTI